MRKSTLLLAGAAFFASTNANATVTVYNNQAAFLAAISAPGTDTYSGFNISGVTSSPVVRNAGAYSYTASTGNGFFGAGTTANPWLSTNTATDSIIFSNFSAGVNAIGGNFFDSNFVGAYALGDITLSLFDGLTTTTQTISNATTNSFLGFVSTGGLTSLTVKSVQPGTPIWPTVDNLTLGKATAAVPEPATWAMMISGFGLVAYSMRRRRQTVSFAA